ncbi:MAG: UDP-N-acetylmuramate--L-alanine ligase [Bacteroidetes bacterium]|nr:UDP-N-acetylmuramate--L-alanine ligase [Bacteroidota bacterium]
MNKAPYQHIFFLGIGGIGMSALARYFNHAGYSVSGYDKTATPLTDQLKKEGISILFNDDVEQLKEYLPENQEGLLVVYTPAIPTTSHIFNYFKDEEIEMIKRAKALGEVTRETRNLSIAGTHGKTTTSCLLAHIMASSAIPSVSLLGGISSNLGSNYFNTAGENQNPYSVTEADEFDRSFLQLSPYAATITSIDADHLDIYGSVTEIRQSFLEFARRVSTEGILFIQHDAAGHFRKAGIKHQRYGIQAGDVYADNLRIKNYLYQFDLHFKDKVITDLELGIPGRHNVENAVAACALATYVGVDEHTLRVALKTFTGVKRRFEYICREPIVYIDDYAHHPSELNAIIGSVKALYPHKKITGVFQPHLYSRTKDFASGFSESLSALDRVFLLDIYPARELPIPGVTSSMLMKNITSPCELVLMKNAVSEVLKSEPEVLLTLGAGDIDTLVPKFKKAIES